MIGAIIKIHFKDTSAFITDIPIDLTQVDLLASKSLRFKKPRIWNVEILSYNKTDESLFLKIRSYDDEPGFTPLQVESAELLRRIKKIKFQSTNTFTILDQVEHTNKVYTKQSKLPFKKESTHIYEEKHTIPIKKLKFSSGKVEYSIEVANFPRTIQILNEHIIPEYDAVKNYFANVLGTKKINAIVKVEITGRNVSTLTATSVEIDRINDDTIEQIKFEFVKKAKSQKLSKNEQIFTWDKYLETLSIKSLISFKNHDDFLSYYINNFETKHYRNLRYLSSKQAVEEQKLQIIHDPFSFLFLLKSPTTIHLVWETLDTQEATYIWAYSSNEIQFAILETHKKIRQIISEGKIKYLQNPDTNFNRIFHDYSDLENGFKKWKSELDELIKIGK